MLDFCELLVDCQLKDLGFSGPRYTWCNKRGDSAMISERLIGFWGICLGVTCMREPLFCMESYSDHLPIWLDVMGVINRRRRPKPFRFEAMWLGEEDCAQIVKYSWRQSVSHNCLQGVMLSIYGCSSKLQLWNKVKFGKVQVNLQEARQS